MSLIPTSFKIGVGNGWIFMSVFLLQMMVILFLNKQAGEKGHIPAGIKRTKAEICAGYFANFIWLLTLVLSVFLPLQINTYWFYIGFFLFLFGLVILSFATFDFITTPADQVISKGVYKFSRHPMYLATFAICIGTGIACFSKLFILLTILMVVFFYIEAVAEEKYCLNKYREDYLDYINRTPRWLGVPKK